jgi:Tfp pilus assembly protein PilO
MAKMNLSLRNIDRMCLAIVLVFSVLCGSLAFSHVMKKNKQFIIEKDILSKRMNEVNLAATNLVDLKAALGATKSELNYLNERIPESGNIGLLLKQIDALMKQRKIALISLQPLPVEKENIYLKNPIQLAFKGNFVDIYAFIKDVEGMNRMVVMEKITITKPENSDQCRAELMASVFQR